MRYRTYMENFKDIVKGHLGIKRREKVFAQVSGLSPNTLGKN